MFRSKFCENMPSVTAHPPRTTPAFELRSDIRDRCIQSWAAAFTTGFDGPMRHQLFLERIGLERIAAGQRPAGGRLPGNTCQPLPDGVAAGSVRCEPWPGSQTSTRVLQAPSGDLRSDRVVEASNQSV